MRFVVDTERHLIERPDGSTVSWFDDGRALLGAWWLASSWATRESYGVRFRGRPVIQLPGDLLALHELVHRIRPTVIIETGVAHGGSILFHAAQLMLLHGTASGARVIGVECEMRAANRAALTADPLDAMITVLEGDSASADVAGAVRGLLDPADRVLVILDSAHDRAHVAAELRHYAPMVTPGSAVVVMDTITPQLADLPGGDPRWRESHPGAAVEEFLASDAGRSFHVDPSLPRDGVTHFPRGILLRSDCADP